MKKYLIVTLIFLCSANMLRADNWFYNLEEAQKMALATNKLILVDFWATWCGPCKKMDLESWNKDDVKALMSNYIPVKIDIDSNTEIANKYSIRSIPYVFILDGNGKIVYKSLSYKSKSQVIKLLETYTLNTEFLNKELISYYKNPSFVSAYRLASKYQDFSLFLNEDIRTDFIGTSDRYFDEALDFLKEGDQNNKVAFQQKIEFYEIQKQLLLNNAKKASKLLGKINTDEVHEMNKTFFAYLNYATCKFLNDADNIKLWEAQVNENDKKKVELLLKSA